MSKGKKIILGVLAGFLCISLLHVWLNIGFDKFMPARAGVAQNSVRVGYLPVT
jgi:hypothetical protein